TGVVGARHERAGRVEVGRPARCEGARAGSLVRLLNGGGAKESVMTVAALDVGAGGGVGGAIDARDGARGSCKAALAGCDPVLSRSRAPCAGTLDPRVSGGAGGGDRGAAAGGHAGPAAGDRRACALGPEHG